MTKPFMCGVGAVLLASAGLVGCSEEDAHAGGDTDAAGTLPAVPAAEGAAPRPEAPLPDGTTCITSKCHTAMATAPTVHGVLRIAGSCSTCHEDDQGGHVFPVRREGNAGCTFCHEDIINNKLHRHGGADVDCLSCHDPHTSEQRALLRSDSIRDLCAGCHELAMPRVPHGPFAAGECVACHEPHESDFAGLLRGGEGADHCARCHPAQRDAMARAAFVHEPAATGCMQCHEPHGGEFRYNLRHEVDVTCIACHEDIGATVAQATAPHGALTLDEKCANCHDPHASDHPKLLRERQDVLCLKCHDQPITANDGRTIPDMSPSIRDREFLHGPVRTGDCIACHNVHGGTNTRLLAAEFTESFYTSFDLSHYALCFQCHESELVTTERTEALTNFRNGDLNLHYLHVHREQKGRTCRTCHELHGSDLPAHVAETVPFDDSGWSMPIGFVKTDTGGGCAPGCHKPLRYDRVTPVALPPPSGETP